METRIKYVVIAATTLLLGYSGLSIAQETISEELKRLVQQASSSYIFILQEDYPAPQIETLAASIARKHDAQVRHVFTSVIKGFSLTVPEWRARKIAHGYPQIAYIEDNGMVWLTAQQSTPGQSVINAGSQAKHYPITLAGRSGADHCDALLAKIDRTARRMEIQHAEAVHSPFDSLQHSKALEQALQRAAMQGIQFIFNTEIAAQGNRSEVNIEQEIDINALFIGGGKTPFTTVASE